MSPQARRERAYRHYVAKHMRERQKQMARAQKAANRQLKQKLKNLQPGPPQMSTSLEDAASMPSSVETAPAPYESAVSQSDITVAPVTVSAHDDPAPQNPEQPSQP
ncbi:MAG TPA: hypothetical protein VJ721_09690 [Chthoniobacterales bacterium]|nr:hypothetical protein [Chthoniobacterales bacterium]